MRQMQKTILSSSLHIKNVQAERLDIYSQTFFFLLWAFRRNNNNNNNNNNNDNNNNNNNN